MKTVLPLLAILFILTTSCRKKVYNITPAPIDSTFVLPQSKLIGSWSDGISTHKKPTFTKETLQWNDETPVRYIASTDTVYQVYPNNSIFALFGYKLSQTDSLTMYSIGVINGNEIKVFTRVK